MELTSLFTLCGGLAFFLYGMTTMSKSLEKMAGGRLERLLRTLTASRCKGLALGAVITVAIQSSSAMTVMLVGLVNSGVMELWQTVSVIMGSNIGTTLTPWVLALTGMESAGGAWDLLRPESFSPLAALAGVVLMLGSRRQRRRDLGRILVGFAILMYGMQLMQEAVLPLAELPGFSRLLTAFAHPLLGLLAGAVFTGVIQSSAASVGILQALSRAGSLSYAAAIPIILGQNIGTCVTAMLSAIGVNRRARQVAVVHIAFNVLGSAAFLLLFWAGGALLDLPLLERAVTPMGIAACHTVFNVGTTCLLLPFSRQLERLAEGLLPGGDKPRQEVFLDPLLLRTPGAALSECAVLAGRMGALAREDLAAAMAQVEAYTPQRARQIQETETLLDTYEDRLSDYLVTLSQHGVSQEDSRTVSRLLHAIGDFERIGDHALNLQESAQALHQEKLSLSASAQSELRVLLTAVSDTADAALTAFSAGDASAAKRVEPLEEAVDQLTKQLRARHIRRLQRGVCSIAAGAVLDDVLTDLERVADHCSNIALAVLDSAAGPHASSRAMKGQAAFSRALARAIETYRLPPEVPAE